jgi:hypothetical protein
MRLCPNYGSPLKTGSSVALENSYQVDDSMVGFDSVYSSAFDALTMRRLRAFFLDLSPEATASQILPALTTRAPVGSALISRAED